MISDLLSELYQVCWNFSPHLQKRKLGRQIWKLISPNSITRKLNTRNLNTENSTQENSTRENSTRENSTHFKHLIIVIYIIHLYSFFVPLIIYAFETIFVKYVFAFKLFISFCFMVWANVNNVSTWKTVWYRKKSQSWLGVKEIIRFYMYFKWVTIVTKCKRK